jgi:hypothetical protein
MGHLKKIVITIIVLSAMIATLKVAANRGMPDWKSDQPVPLSTDTRQTTQMQYQTVSEQLSSISPQERKKRAMQLLDYVLANAIDVKPAEYGVLTQVECATLLWRFDKERSISILKEAVKTLREITKDNQDINRNDYFYETKGRKLRFLIVRKIAALRPELVKELFSDRPTTEPSQKLVADQWTDDARAILYVAAEQIETNPKLAVQIAQQAFTAGLADWPSFLRKLGQQDNSEAERLAFLVVDTFRDSSLTPIVLLNLYDFMLANDRSLNLKEHFLQAVLVRLQREVSADLIPRALEDDMIVARQMARYSAKVSLHWQAEFQNLANQFEAIFQKRSQEAPGSLTRKVIDISEMNPAVPADVSEIRDAALKLQAMKDSPERDKQYQKLATQAAFNADPRMADELLSKIADPLMRQETSLMVYSPLVRKSVADEDWTQAQTYALRILDPVGQVLVMDSVAQAMTKAKVEKHRVVYGYSLLLSKLDHQEASSSVAKAFLLAAKSLINLDKENCYAAVNYAVDTINQVTKGGSAIEEAPVTSTLSTWVRYPNYFLRPDEILDLNDTLGVIFTELAKRDQKNVYQMAVNINHAGLRALAQLAICRAELGEMKNLAAPVKPKKSAAEK